MLEKALTVLVDKVVVLDAIQKKGGNEMYKILYLNKVRESHLSLDFVQRKETKVLQRGKSFQWQKKCNVRSRHIYFFDHFVFHKSLDFIFHEIISIDIWRTIIHKRNSWKSFLWFIF